MPTSRPPRALPSSRPARPRHRFHEDDEITAIGLGPRPPRPQTAPPRAEARGTVLPAPPPPARPRLPDLRAKDHDEPAPHDEDATSLPSFPSLAEFVASYRPRRTSSLPSLDEILERSGMR